MFIPSSVPILIDALGVPSIISYLTPTKSHLGKRTKSLVSNIFVFATLSSIGYQVFALAFLLKSISTFFVKNESEFITKFFLVLVNFIIFFMLFSLSEFNLIEVAGSSFLLILFIFERSSKDTFFYKKICLVMGYVPMTILMFTGVESLSLSLLFLVKTFFAILYSLGLLKVYRVVDKVIQ